MRDSFWTGGDTAYSKGLADEYQAQLVELQSRLDGSDGQRRECIEKEIEQLHQQYRSKVDSIKDAMF
ncbi:MAG: hypothetical protein AAGJ40_04400 [Planctomycetota bacterium]